MPIRERIDSVERVGQWTDDIPLKYQYTAGVAGELFFEWLQKGRIEASKCDNCNVTCLPPRIYCLECFHEVHSYVHVENSGRVKAITLLGDGGPSYVFVSYPKIRGGILHKVISGRPRVGSRAVAVFKPEEERKGSILDIVGFSIL